MSKYLEGPPVLVTGASAGIDSAVVEQLAAESASYPLCLCCDCLDSKLARQGFNRNVVE